VAISADGNTAIVGGLFDNGGAGAAWVWTRNGEVWTQQGNKLVGSGAVSPDGAHIYQGESVAISADGNTAIVGGAAEEWVQDQTGAAWVWTRSEGVWTQQGNKLVGSGPVGTSYKHITVALSGDGKTAIIGDNLDNNGVGAVWIWTRSGGVWTQQGKKLVGSGAAICVVQGCSSGARQGSSVALSTDGNTAIVGAFNDNPFIPTGYPPDDLFTQGAAWVWTRSGGVWTQQGDKLVGSGNFMDPVTGTSSQGASVALAGDGNTAIIGGSIGPGAAWIWTRSGEKWTERARLSQPNVSAQGDSVSLSLDGNTAMVAGYLGASATWVWTKTGGVWPQQGIRLHESNAVGESYADHSARMSADGKTVIVGKGIDNNGVGAAWIFAATPLPTRARAARH